MVDYHTNSVCAGLAVGNATDQSKNPIFDRYGPIASAEVDGMLKPHAETVPFSALPNTPQTVQTLTNVMVVRFFHAEIKTTDPVILKHLQELYDSALESAISEAKATPTSRTKGPMSVSGSYATPLINEDDWNGENSDVASTTIINP